MSQPPLCLWCGEKPVRKDWNKTKRHLYSRPVGNGTVAMWRNYCSRNCSGQAAQGWITREGRARTTAILNAYNRERTKERYIRTIREVMGASYRDGDHVTLAQLIRIARRADLHGWHRCWNTKRRAEKRAA